MIDISKPPERGDKTTEEYIEVLKRWSYKVYDAIRYINEQGGTNNNVL